MNETPELFLQKILSQKETFRYYYSENDFIYYEVFGKGPNNLLLIHGFACSHLNWYEMIPYISGENVKIIVPDMKGFGESSKPRDESYTYQDHSKIIFSLIQKLNLINLTLIGHSYGGGIALMLTLNQSVQKYLKRLILIDSASFRDSLPLFVKILSIRYINYFIMNLLTANKQTVKVAVKRIFHNKDKVSNAILNYYRPYFYQKKSRYSYIKTVKYIIPDEYDHIISEYQKIPFPTLIIWGESDPVIPLDFGIRLHKLINGSQLKIIEKCGHVPMEEFPVETASLINTFIQNETKN